MKPFWIVSKAKPKQSTSLKRKATLALLLVSTASLAQLLPTGGAASGESLQNARTQATAIVARLNILGAQVSSLAEKYNQAQLSLANVNQQVNNAQNQISQTQAKIASIKSQLSQEAINAYISGGNLPGFSALLSENPTEASVRVEYLNTVTNSQTDLIALFQDATQSLQQQQLSLKALQAKAASAFDQVSNARSAAQTAVNQENAQLGSVNSTIALLVAQQQQLLAQEAASAAQGTAASAAQGTAASAAQGTAASTRQVITGSSSGPPSGSSAPSLSGGQIGIALSWARQQLGKPYQFGAAGPNAFDCSGLTAFAFAKAGIFLPHSAAAQYSDTTRVSLSSLQPGDLVFYYSPISHVAIYIGGGQVLQALNEASPVEISGIYWDGLPAAAGRL